MVTFFKLAAARKHLLEVGRAGAEDEAVSADDMFVGRRRRVLAVGARVAFLLAFMDSTSTHVTCLTSSTFSAVYLFSESPYSAVQIYL